MRTTVDIQNAQILEPYQVSAKACGWCPGIDLMHLNRIADEIEDEDGSIAHSKGAIPKTS